MFLSCVASSRDASVVALLDRQDGGLMPIIILLVFGTSGTNFVLVEFYNPTL